MSELLIDDKFLYVLAGKDHYETLTRYSAILEDFCVGLKRRMPSDWTLHRSECWMHCTGPEAIFPDQGWKIHLSATPAHAPAILVTAATILFEAGVPFKFIADRNLLSQSIGKRWPRGGAGKFMAIYPKDDQQCAELLEKLHQATLGFNGPYILSDRRYQDSRIVFYRYGGLHKTQRLAPDGTKQMVITDQDGQYIPDDRDPFFHLPPGVEDPFVTETPNEDEAAAGTLKGGRYQIESVIQFSNSGGVYLAFDHVLGIKVVIKEARPFTNISTRGLDAVALLKKEHRVLSCLADTDIGPKAIDFFFDWEHAYLVEEYLEKAVGFREYMGDISLSLRTRPTQQDSQLFIERYCRLVSKLASVIRELHKRHIVFGDVSMANVMITKLPADDDILVQLIDFEGSHESNVDLAAHLFTPGYSSQEFMDRGVTSADDDLYGLGSLMLAGLFPMNTLLSLDRGAHIRFLEGMSQDFGLPLQIRKTIEGLLSKRELRPTLDQVIEVLTTPYVMPVPHIGSQEFSSLDAHQYLSDIMRYVDSTADYTRSDRLFPADPEVFASNPLSLSHGACGVALVQKRVRGTVSPEVLDWIKQFPLRRDALSPGLYSGLSGIAWFWLDMGEDERAKEALAVADQHPYLAQSADMFHGLAGWGMTQLRFFKHFGDHSYLDAAIDAGEQLLLSREVETEGQCFWRTPQGLTAGFGHGSAGICTFLLYLYLATENSKFLKAGEEGLAWVMNQGITNEDGGLTWIARESSPSVTPYLRWGSSGIGRAFLRYWYVTGDEKYAELIDKVMIDADRKYTIFPGYFFGLAGIGEFFLDLARFDRWRDSALTSLTRIFSGCSLYALHREQGIAFPGESLMRISCDLGTGGAGIAMVLHRYLTRCGASLMLDDLLPGWAKEDR
ncbi:class III lanthionine synthetase LanKC [Undibacterium sp. Ji22W]|uniref:class III lanthionine synthetase LanKC n=1 Tax=Undibacterium sp. Ji22W TaxID=3413038 RepID=UPI003BF09A2E